MVSVNKDSLLRIPWEGKVNVQVLEQDGTNSDELGGLCSL